MLFKLIALVGTVSASLTCSVTPGTGAGVYDVEMSGSDKAWSSTGCEFAADDVFLSNITITSDLDQNCERASYAGCKAYGSAYSIRCACACDKGIDCTFKLTGTVTIASTAKNARCSCDKAEHATNVLA